VPPNTPTSNKSTSGAIPAAKLEWSPRQVFLATLFVATVLLGLWLLYNFRSAAMILLVAIMLGTGLKPVLNWLTNLGMAPVMSKVLIFFLILGLIFAFLGLALPLLINQTTDLSAQLSEYYTDLRLMLIKSPSEVIRGIGLRLSARIEAADLAAPALEGVPTVPEVDEAQETVNLVTDSFQTAALVFKGILAFLAVFLLAFYWTIEGERVIRAIILLAPTTKREYFLEVIKTIEAKLGGFILGQSVLCLIIAGMSLIAYMLIGLPNAFILAIIAGILEAVPVVGPALGAIPALAVALTMGPDKVVLVLLASIIIQLLENNILVPRVMNRAVGVHPFLTLISLAVFYSILGIGGALLAVPMAAIFQYLINRFVILPLQEPSLATDRRDYGSYLQLQAREITRDLRHQYSKLPDGVERTSPFQEQIEAVADELVQILQNNG
jgi:predicted PurR-regulated permease PerM